MHIELTDQERDLARQGQPVDVIDPQTNEAYVLIAKPRFEKMAALGDGLYPSESAPEQEIAEGIRISQEAYRRELPDLLKQKKLVGQWVAYHRSQRIGIAQQGDTLLRECLRRGLTDDEYFLGWIDISGLEEVEEIDSRMNDYMDNDDEDS